MNTRSSRPSRIISDRTGTTNVGISSCIKFYSIGLITDCHESVMFLNKLPMGVLEESLHVFRSNIFSMADRKQIPTQIYKILETELEAEKNETQGVAAVENFTQQQTLHEMVQSTKYDQSLFKVAQEVYHSMQVVLEFMDKGMKGLLTGDLSVYIIQQIQTSIEHF